MLRRFMLALLAAGFLSGCATDRPSTPEQRLYLVTNAYNLLLKESAAYWDRCEAKPRPLQTGCWKTIRILQAIDREAETSFANAFDALENNRYSELDTILDELARITARFEHYLATDLSGSDKI